jgi:GNAT superfamily N-acetyltransferase
MYILDDKLTIRNMTRDEVDELVSWASNEGWNPGLNDAELFWQTDPNAFIAAELSNELIGGGAITSYDDKYGFMGFFIVKPEYRGRGFGNALWHARKERLLARLKEGAAIGMDGVFNMQPYYAKGGFVFSHRNIRFQSTAKHVPVDDSIVPLSEISFDEIATYDQQCFPTPRSHFLKAWITQANSLALGIVVDQKLAGYGVIRRCGQGCKIGPLFANDSSLAEKLFNALTNFAPEEPVYLDIPERNVDAIALAKRHQMKEVFGCARMYFGKKPIVAEHKVFGVTTFELG